jgi:hypothetical protein
MGSARQGRLYRLAKRLSLGRLLRYLALWARYGWRQAQSAFLTRRGRAPGTDAAALAAALAGAEPAAAKRLAVASWFPLDLANAKLHQAVLVSVAAARLDLGVTSEILDCIGRLKTRTISRHASMRWWNRATRRKRSIPPSTSFCSGACLPPRRCR